MIAEAALEADRAENPEEVFEIVGKIGQGSYGSVFKGRNRTTGELVAIKQLFLGNEEELKDIRKEITILRECSHPNIVQYRGTYQSMNALWITMEYCAGGSVDKFFKTRKPLSEHVIQFVTSEVLKGLRYLHRHKKIHRDIKCGNVLITADGQVKLADFGVSAHVNTFSRRNSFIGTLYWMAPEAILEKDYDERADIWSLGITLIEMAEMAPPHFDLHYARALFTIPKEAPPTLQGKNTWSSTMHNFVARCLVKDPAARPTAAQLLSDPFVANVDDAAAALIEIARKARTAGDAEAGRAPSADRDYPPAPAVADYADEATFIERTMIDGGASDDGEEVEEFPTDDDEDLTVRQDSRGPPRADDGRAPAGGGGRPSGESQRSGRPSKGQPRRPSSQRPNGQRNNGAIGGGGGDLDSDLSVLYKGESGTTGDLTSVIDPEGGPGGVSMQGLHAVPTCIADGTVLDLPWLSLSDLSLDDLTRGRKKVMDKQAVANLLSSRPLESTVIDQLPEPLPVTKALAGCYEHFKYKYEKAVTADECEAWQEPASKYGSFLKTVMQI